MISGPVLRTRRLQSGTGRPVTLRVIRATPPSRATLTSTSSRWMALAQGQRRSRPEASRRARFAADVAYVAARALPATAGRNPKEHVLVAIDGKGEVLGITIFQWDPVRQAWHLDLQTVRPVDQPGWPGMGRDQVRGIGSELLGEAVAQMNKRACAPVELEPLDAAAKRFWLRRGFHNSRLPMRMSCPESRTLARLLAHTEHDDPLLGDAPYAGGSWATLGHLPPVTVLRAGR